MSSLDIATLVQGPGTLSATFYYFFDMPQIKTCLLHIEIDPRIDPLFAAGHNKHILFYNYSVKLDTSDVGALYMQVH